MTKILFVCLGNICRSPMAEFVMKDLAKHRTDIYIESAATSPYEVGSPVHHGTRKILNDLGISTNGKVARQLTTDDYLNFDLIICMDKQNMNDLKRIFNDTENKIHLLLEYCGRNEEIADPYYSGNFQKTYEDVLEGCTALFNQLGG